MRPILNWLKEQIASGGGFNAGKRLEKTHLSIMRTSVNFVPFQQDRLALNIAELKEINRRIS